MNNTFYLVLNNFENLNALIEFQYETDYALSEKEKNKYDLMLLSEFTKSDELSYIGEFGTLNEHIKIAERKIPELLEERGIELKDYKMKSLDFIDVMYRKPETLFLIQTSITEGNQFGYFNRERKNIDTIQNYLKENNINTGTYQIDDELLECENVSLSGREAFFLEQIEDIIGFPMVDSLSVFDLENNIKMFISENLSEINNHYNNPATTTIPYQKKLEDTDVIIELEKELTLEDEYKGYNLEDDIAKLSMFFTVINNGHRYKIDTDRYIAIDDLEKEQDLLFVDKNVKSAFESFFEYNKKKRQNTLNTILSNIGKNEPKEKKIKKPKNK